MNPLPNARERRTLAYDKNGHTREGEVSELAQLLQGLNVGYGRVSPEVQPHQRPAVSEWVQVRDLFRPEESGRENRVTQLAT